MRIIAVVAAVWWTVLSSSQLLAGPAEDMARCVAIRADAARLKCFDELAGSNRVKAAPGGYRTMDLLDLQLDIGKLAGTRVEVEGDGLVFMGKLGLTKSKGASEPVFVDVDRAPRTSRRAVIERCGARYCTVVVKGKVGTVLPGMPGIIADDVLFQ